MPWYDISGPDFFDIDYVVQSGGETPTASWDGTEADLTHPGGYNDQNIISMLNLIPKQFVIDEASNVTQLRLTMRATFGASPGDIENQNGFLLGLEDTLSFGVKFPDTSWSQDGTVTLVKIVPDDYSVGGLGGGEGEVQDMLNAAGFTLSACDGVQGAGFGVIEAVQRYLDATIVSIESDYQILPPGSQSPRFWTNYTIAQEIDL